MGIPNALPQDMERLRIGNLLLKASARVVQRCWRHRIPVTLENPRRSRIWWTPIMITLLKRGRRFSLDYCCFGMTWQKSTSFAAWGLPELENIAICCQPKQNVCSTSGKRHRRLEGRAAAGIDWTLLAEPYPWKLVHQIAETVSKTKGGRR